MVPIQEKNSSGNTSRSMAAISLGFIVMVTPWTIQEIVTACTGSKASPHPLVLVVYWGISQLAIYCVQNSEYVIKPRPSHQF